MEELRPRILQHRSKLDMLIANKEALKSELSHGLIPEIDLDTQTAYIDDFLVLLEEETIAEKRAFIRGFIKQLTVKDGVATLEYTLPLASSTLSLIEEKEEVLSFEQYGGRYWI